MSITKKIVATITAVTCAAWMIGPSTAQAATAAELQAQIDALLAQLTTLQGQLAGLTGGAAGVMCTFTRPLYPGVSGADVQCLQQYLNGAGYPVAASGPGSAGNETQYFGSLTQAAVKNWQDANGIVYGSYGGYFGPVSQAKYNALMATAAEEEEEEEEEESSELEGGAGSISDADWISGLSGEEVGEDEEDVEVAGLEIEADDGSDIALRAVRLDFTQGTADQDFDEYAAEVSLWFNDDEVARVDADEFDDDNGYDKTITLLDSGACIIEAGETGDLVVAVSGISNLDTNDVGETWTVEFESIRFQDATGAIITDNATGDINGVTRTFSFESYATAANAELRIAEDDKDINNARMINVHATDDTDDVNILSFTLEAQGDSDLEFREFGVDFVVAGADNVDDIIAGGTSPEVSLVIDGEEYGTATYNEDADGVDVGADEEVLFDDIDYTLEAGEEVECMIVISLLAIDTDLDEGDTIYAQITETQTDDTALCDVRDESGEQLADADIIGQVIGEACQLYDQTFELSNIEWTTVSVNTFDTAGFDDYATFELTFDLTAVDGIIYVDDACTEDSDGTPSSDGMNYSCSNDADFSFACLISSSTADAGDNYVVNEDDTESFTYTITVTADQAADDTARLTLEGIEWSEADEAGDRLYTGSLNDYYQSEGVYLRDN